MGPKRKGQDMAWPDQVMGFADNGAVDANFP
jgi:hypothetical protein